MKRPIDVVVELPRGYKNIDFDQKKVRKVILKEAREIRKIARRLVARRAISKPGEFPGRGTGELMRSIKVVPLGKSMGAMVMPHKTPAMDVFYPGILNRGSKRRLGKLEAGEGRGKSNRRARGERVRAMLGRASSGEYIIQPRENYMEAALSRRRSAARAAISAILQDALVPRK